MRFRGILSLTILGALLAAAPASAATKCDLFFHLEGWSAFYKTARGGGRVVCDNGQSRSVALRVKGGGVTFGRSAISGRGDFSPVGSIGEVFGDYANAEAHAGMVKSAGAQVVTKGTVSLALKGKGEGIDLGFAFGKMTIAPAGGGHHARRHARR